MRIDPNKDNGSITIRENKLRDGYYMANSLEDREIMKFLGFDAYFKKNQIDNFIETASKQGFTVQIRRSYEIHKQNTK